MLEVVEKSIFRAAESDCMQNNQAEHMSFFTFLYQICSLVYWSGGCLTPFQEPRVLGITAAQDKPSQGQARVTSVSPGVIGVFGK